MKQMKQMKQMGALALAGMTVLCSVNVPVVYAAEADLANGIYEAEAHFMKSSKISEASMCDGLFYSTITAEVKGDMTDLTFYVLDPIPTFSTAGQPITEMYFTYEETDYTADIDDSNQITKDFDVNFMGTIQGDYPCDTITVSVPTKAVADSADGSLYCTAYVNAVMASYQNFYMVIDMENASFTADESGSDDDSSSEDTTERTTVKAVKTGTDTASSMDGYLYQYPDIVHANDGYDITLYMTADEISYVTYGDVKSNPQEDAKTVDQTSYDAFTIHVDSLEDRVNISAYVNQMAAIMPAYALQAFDLVFDYADMATKSDSQSMELTANVEAEDAAYYVTIPAALSLGSLSRTEDTEIEYEIAVDADTLNDGYVQVSAPTEGNLVSGNEKIAFTNTFGSKNYSASATEKAKITVAASEVSKVGNYTGTTTFAIDYFAAN